MPAHLPRAKFSGLEQSLPFFVVLRAFDTFEWEPKQDKAFDELKTYI
jgi:hypothetical protein